MQQYQILNTAYHREYEVGWERDVFIQDQTDICRHRSKCMHYIDRGKNYQYYASWKFI